MTLKTQAKKPTILVMGDQINRNISSLMGHSPSTARILMVEIEKKFDSFIKSPSVWHYRNKMDYSFSSIGYNKKLKEIVD